MSKISVKNIDFFYNDKMVFKDFSMEFEKGKASVIMSPSGAGKTTLLFLIAGLIKPNSGEIYRDNARFSFVFQDDKLIENVNVEKNICLVKDNIDRDDLNKCLSALGLSDYKKKKVRFLSGGEKKRVAIARALMADYDVLLLDEPFSGIDNDTKDKVIEYIKEKTVDKTVILVTHNKDDAYAFGYDIYSIGE